MFDFANDGKYGTIVKADIVNELSEILFDLTNKDYSSESICKMKKYARDKLTGM